MRLTANARVIAKQVLRIALERTQFRLASSGARATDGTPDRDALFALRRALDAIRAAPDGYGECEHCGELISDRRMDAAPWSTRCDRHANDPIQ